MYKIKMQKHTNFNSKKLQSVSLVDIMFSLQV